MYEDDLAKYGIEPFLLYVGRKEAGKNVPLLIDYFAQYKRQYGGELCLVLVGKGAVEIPPDRRHNILDLGFLSEQDKLDAYAAALALCQPSCNESFSIVMMEAWVAGTPTLVHANCAVTRGIAWRPMGAYVSRMLRSSRRRSSCCRVLLPSDKPWESKDGDMFCAISHGKP
jgi:glycosyltransferase involved in cell wall biosynthesis